MVLLLKTRSAEEVRGRVGERRVGREPGRAPCLLSDGFEYLKVLPVFFLFRFSCVSTLLFHWCCRDKDGFLIKSIYSIKTYVLQISLGQWDRMSGTRPWVDREVPQTEKPRKHLLLLLGVGRKRNQCVFRLWIFLSVADTLKIRTSADLWFLPMWGSLQEKASGWHDSHTANLQNLGVEPPNSRKRRFSPVKTSYRGLFI